MELCLSDNGVVILRLSILTDALKGGILPVEDRQMPQVPLRLAGGLDSPVAYDTAVASYIEDMTIRGNSRGHRTKERSALRLAARIMEWQSLDDLTTESVRAYLLRLTSANRAPKTMKLYRDALDRFCKWCCRNRLAARNPIEGVPAPICRPHASRVIPTPDELRRIIAAGASDWRAKDWWLAVLTMASTGLRVSETRALQWSMIHGNTISLPAAITKSRRDQRAFLTPELAGLLERHKDLAGDRARVFQSGLKREQMLVYCRKAGVERVRGTTTLSYHSLRHFFSNRLMTMGFTPEERQQAMRHSNISMTVGVYSDPAQVAAGAKFASIAPLLSGTVDENPGRKVFDNREELRYLASARSTDPMTTNTVQLDASTTGGHLGLSSAIWRLQDGGRGGPPAAERLEQGVAQLGRASRLGREGRGLKSHHPDLSPTDAESGREVQIPRPTSGPDSVPTPESEVLSALAAVPPDRRRALLLQLLALLSVLAVAGVAAAYTRTESAPTTVVDVPTRRAR